MANKYLDKTGLQRVKRDLDIQLGDYGKTLKVSINSSTYVMTLQLKNGHTILSEQTVDLPLESVVVGGSYDSDNEKIVLTLQNGQTIDIPVSDLVSGLVSQSDLTTTLASYYTSSETNTLLGGKQDTIDSTHKLSADLIDDSDTTNKFVSESEKTTWNAKQDELTTSLDTETLTYFVGFNSDGKLSKGSPQTITIATEVQENNNNAVSSDAVFDYAYPLTNPNGYISGINGTMVTNALGYNPYNASNPSGYQANVIESISINGTTQTITNKNVDLPAYPTKTSLGLDNVVNVGMDNVPTQYSDNYVKSGGVYEAIEDVAEIAEGKTRNYVISDSALTGYVNDSFNSTNDTITIAISGNKIKDIENNDVNLSAFKVGDIISITETNVPDRWVGSISGGNIVFYKLETKIDVASSVQSGNANPVSSGGVYNALYSASIVPTTNNTYNLGSSSYSFYEGYIKDIYASSYQIEGYTFATMGGSAFDVGNGNKELDLWGSGTRPTYNEKDIMVIDDELKTRYHLGAYDTVDTSNSGYDLITRKTGYARLNELEVSLYSTNTFLLYLKDGKNIDNLSSICNKYKQVQTSVDVSSMDNVYKIFANAGAGYPYLYIKDTSYSTVDSFKASLFNAYMQYELATSFTEKVIKNQSLDTLDQRGSQWVRNEWEKTLNLLNNYNPNVNNGLTFSPSATGFTLSGATGQWSNIIWNNIIEANKTYVLTFNATISGNANPYVNFYDGTSDDNRQIVSGANSFTITKTALSNITWYVNRGGTSGTLVLTNIMLNEGSVALPYQPYSGEIVHKGDIEPVLLWQNSSPTSQIGNDTLYLSQNISNFKYIVIEFYDYCDSSYILNKRTMKFEVELNRDLQIFFASAYSSNWEIVTRPLHIPSSGDNSIAIYQAVHIVNGSLETSTKNQYCKPVAIYGTNIL